MLKGKHGFKHFAELGFKQAHHLAHYSWPRPLVWVSGTELQGILFFYSLAWVQSHKGALSLEAPLGLRCLRATVAVNVEHDSYSILKLFQAISLCRQSLITDVCIACYGSFLLELCLSEIHVRGKLFTVSL